MKVVLLDDQRRDAARTFINVLLVMRRLWRHSDRLRGVHIGHRQAPGCDQATVQHKPNLLSDNGPSYIADDWTKWIEVNGMRYVDGAPLHPQT